MPNGGDQRNSSLWASRAALRVVVQPAAAARHVLQQPWRQSDSPAAAGTTKRGCVGVGVGVDVGVDAGLGTGE